VRILVLGINYVPEKTGIAPFTTGLCQHLAEQGHDVKVVTAFPYYPGWKVFEGYRGSRYRREIIDGVVVHRAWHFVPWRPSSLWQRLAHDLSFTATAFLVGLFSGKCDVVYCCCPPPTLGLTAYLLSEIKRARFVVKLADLASDAALATGIMRDGLAVRLARRLEAFVYGRATSVVCLCQGFIERLSEREVPREKLPLIPDWGDTERIRPLQSSARFRAENDIASGQFLVLHTGNMGKKQDLMNAVKAAELLGERQAIQWILVGDGEERPLLERESAVRAPHTVRLLPLQPVEVLPHMYAEADLLLLNQKSTVEDAVIPSKLLTYMAAGRPIVAAVSERSEAARHIESAGCGVVIPSENPQALADTVLRLSSDSELRTQLGANGRAYAEAHFTKRAVLRQYDLFFDRICHEPIPAACPLRPGRAREARQNRGH
jgi:colanic acid biosynthesis glycosyl transferase WcaI